MAALSNGTKLVFPGLAGFMTGPEMSPIRSSVSRLHFVHARLGQGHGTGTETDGHHLLHE